MVEEVSENGHYVKDLSYENETTNKVTSAKTSTTHFRTKPPAWLMSMPNKPLSKMSTTRPGPTFAAPGYRVVKRSDVQRRNRRATISHVKCIMPATRRPKLLINVDVSPSQMEFLMEAKNNDIIKGNLCKIFYLEKHNRQDQVILDFHFYNLQFAKEQKMSNEKTSTFISIMKNVFEYTTETPLTNLRDVFRYFKGLLVTHSVNRSPWSLEVFSQNDVKIISKYAINTFFRHYRMYKYSFTSKPELDLTISYIGDNVKPPKGREISRSDTFLPRGSIDHDKNEVESRKVSSTEEDNEREKAREALKEFIKQFLVEEMKKIEVDVETHIKGAVAMLHNKIDECRLERKRSSRRSLGRTERSRSMSRIQSRSNRNN